jgi:autotransporter-associated beta strand protein
MRRHRPLLLAGGALTLAALAAPAAAQTFVAGTLDLQGANATLPVAGVTGTILGADGALLVVTNSGPGVATLTQGGGTATYAGTLTDGAGALALVHTGGTLTLTGANAHSGGTTLRGGTLVVDADARLGAGAGALTFDGGALRVTNSFTLGAGRAVTLGPNGGTIDTNFEDLRIDQPISGAGALTVVGGGLLRLGGANAYTGATLVEGADLVLRGSGSLAASRVILQGGSSLDISTISGATTSVGSIESATAAPDIFLGDRTLTVGGNGLSTTFRGVIRDGGLGEAEGGSLVKIGAGALTLTNLHQYTGTTRVVAGTLVVNGSIASSSLLTVEPGGTVAGVGVLPSTIVRGAISPGTSPGVLTVQGSLTFQAGGVYVAEVLGAVADRVTVTGAATLAGTLRLAPLGGPFLFNTPYVLLSAAAGRTGVFATVETQGSFGAGVTSVIDYTATEVRLILAAATLAPTAMAATPAMLRLLPTIGSCNAISAAIGLDRALLAGADPSALSPLYGQPAAALPMALAQVSGEIHTAPPQLAGLAAGRFLAALTERRREGPRDPKGGTNEALEAWIAGTGAGASQRAGCGAALAMEHSGLAAGLEARLDADTTIGFAMGGSAGGARLAHGLGGADGMFGHAGLAARTRFGGLAIGGALAFSFGNVGTNRAVPVLGVPSLVADAYLATASARIEAAHVIDIFDGARLAPFVAAQAHATGHGGYAERNPAGGLGAGARIDGRTAVEARVEVGLHAERDVVFGGIAGTVTARLAWAHHLANDTTAGVALIGVPGARFAVEGARVDRDVALLTLGLEALLAPNATLGMRFEGEFGAESARYAGSARLRIAF